MTTVYSTRTLTLQGGTLVDHESETRLELGSDPVLLGRDPSCSFVVDASGVSAVHAEVTAMANGVRLRDLGSKNGTWLGDVRVREVVLTEAAEIALGRAVVSFEPAKPKRLSLPDIDAFGAMVGVSAPMRDLFRRLSIVAPTELSVLVQGETGTGKELVARAIHDASPRRGGPFVIVDCGAIPASLAEATLFGHEKGAYTGATVSRSSPFVDADGGTIFLDELGELPLDVQPKLLRALAERRIKAVGSNAWKAFDARIVAATRRDIEGAVATEAFRSDLYFRIAQVRLHVPPLRERLDDIPLLVRRSLELLGEPGAFRRVPRHKLEPLYRHRWPGNVRELKSAVAVALALAGSSETIDLPSALGLKTRSTGRGSNVPHLDRGYHESKRAALSQFERAYFVEAFQACGGNLTEIARRTGLHRMHVRRYLRAHGIK